MSFDSKGRLLFLSDTLEKCLSKISNDFKLYNKIINTINSVSRDIKKAFQKDADSTKNSNKISEKYLKLKCAISNAATLRTILIHFTTLCYAKNTSSTVFYQSHLRNKRIYLNKRVLPRYVCMNNCNDSSKVVNILQNVKEMEFRASSYAPNVLKQTGFYCQTDIRIPNLSRLTIYLTELYRTILFPTKLLSKDHIKILPVPNGDVFSLDVYFSSCLLIVL